MVFLLKNVVTSRPKVATRIGHGMKENRISHSHSIMFVGFGFFPTMVIREVRSLYVVEAKSQPDPSVFWKPSLEAFKSMSCCQMGPIVRSGS